MSMLSEQALREIERVRMGESGAQHALLTALRLVQAERRKVGAEEIEYVAKLLDLSPAVAEGVARFYDHFSGTRSAEHTLLLCRGISCYLCGGDDVAAQVRDLLSAVDLNGAGSKVDVRHAECIGHCDHAPAGLLDDRFLGPLRAEDLAIVLGALMEEPR